MIFIVATILGIIAVDVIEVIIGCYCYRYRDCLVAMVVVFVGFCVIIGFC